MPRPTTKKQLLEAMQTEQQSLEELLAGLSPDQMTRRALWGNGQ